MRTRRIKGLDGAGVYHCVSHIVGLEGLMGFRERDYFVELMQRVAVFCGIELLGFCVMSDHFHLVARVKALRPMSEKELLRRFVTLYGEGHKQTVELNNLLLGKERKGAKDKEKVAEIYLKLTSRMADISFFMKELKQRYTTWYNRRKGRFGTLWAERFKSVLMEDNAQMIQFVCEYINYNPVRRGEVSSPSEYTWCTAGAKRVGDARLSGSVKRQEERLQPAAGHPKESWKGGWEEIYGKRIGALSNGLFIGSVQFVGFMISTCMELPGWSRRRCALNLFPEGGPQIQWKAGRNSRMRGRIRQYDSS